MNPFAQPDLLHPSFQPDYRVQESGNQDAGLDRSLSSAAYHLVNAVERLLFKS